MRIDAYNAVSQIYQAGTVSTTKGTGAAQTLGDKFEISQTAKSYQTAKAAVGSASDVREDKVALIKSQLAAGTYHVSSEEVADKILNNTDTLTF
jgi:negative regulator of flagellin synthesis FlgM